MGEDPERWATPRGCRRALERRAPAARADRGQHPPEPEGAGRHAYQPRARRGCAQRVADQRLQEPGARSAGSGARGAQLRSGAGAVRAARPHEHLQREHAECDPRLPRRDRAPPAHALARARPAACGRCRAAVAAGSHPQLRRGREAALPRTARRGAAADRSPPPCRGGRLAARGRERRRRCAWTPRPWSSTTSAA